MKRGNFAFEQIAAIYSTKIRGFSQKSIDDESGVVYNNNVIDKRGDRMSYKALYRVFRPQTFADVCGQEHISKTLRNALTTNRLAHAYLFCGPRGTGKTSSAKILAKAVNCQAPIEGEPCNQCKNCMAINQDSFLDVIEIDAASNRGIDEMRQIRDKINFAPSEGKKKVYIIDEVHMLTNEAFNALLKTLEEPPEHILFILATTDPQKIPATVLSRCQRFDFRKISTDAMEKRLKMIAQEEGVYLSEQALTMIVRQADGGLRDAIGLLDQCIAFGGNQVEQKEVESVLGALSQNAIADFIDGMIQDNGGILLEQLNTYASQGKDPRQILKDLIHYVRDLLLLKVGSSDSLTAVAPSDLPKAKEQTKSLSVEFLNGFLNRLLDTEKDMRYATNGQIMLEIALIDGLLLYHGRKESKEKALPKETNEKSFSKSEKSTKAVITSKASVEEDIGIEKIKLNDAKALIDQWPDILKEVKKESVKLFAFLQEGKPMGFEKEALVVKFDKNHKFHSERVMQDENRYIIEKILRTYVEGDIVFQVFCEKEEGEFAKRYDIAKEAIAVFGEDIVTIED